MARRQQEKSWQTQQELVRAAQELFGAKGFHATTVSEITQRAGYAKGSFYRHWASKDDLMLQIIKDKLADYRSARDRRIAEAGSLEEVMHIIWDFLENIIEDKSWSRVFLEFALHASRHEELKARLNDEGYRLNNKIFADLVRPFVGNGFPPEKIGALNTALFEGFLIHNVLDTGALSRNDVKNAAIALALANAGADSDL